MSDKCGTYAGAQRHHKEGTETCDPCKEANNEYQRQYRSVPLNNEVEKWRNGARNRALWMLARRHRGEFDELVKAVLTGEEV